MSTKKENGEVLFVIDEFKVVKGHTYLVKDRKDGDAPSGFVAAGVSKLPSDGVGESFQVYLKRAAIQDKTGAWDTGFYKESPCYAGIDPADATKIVKSRIDNILKPYRMAVGDPEALDHGNQESLDATSFHIWSGRVYRTDDAVDMMHLYIALLSRNAAPMGEEGAAKYRATSYLIVDTDLNKKDQYSNDSKIIKSISAFSILFDQDKDQLDAILKWTNLGKFPAGADKDTASSIFYQTIKDIPSRCEVFLEAVEEMNTNIGKEKMFVYSRLKDMHGRSSKLFTAPSGAILYDEFELGGDLKSAAENIARNPELSTVKREILTKEQ